MIVYVQPCQTRAIQLGEKVSSHACARKEQAFHQEILNDSRTPAAQCCSESQVSLSLRAATQEQTGNVDACDQRRNDRSNPARLREFEGRVRERVFCRLQSIRCKLSPDLVSGHVAAALPSARPSNSSLERYFTCARIFSLSTWGNGASGTAAFFVCADAILSREDAYESKRGARENHPTFLHETPQ